ncbi:MAG: protease pro-enzyme activation domain-containing protein, partial [Solirubrobacteraceae bacterium]
MAQRVEIPGSARAVDPEHQQMGAVDSEKTIDVTVYLRPSGSLDWVDQEAGRAPAERRTMSRDELASATGASDEDIAAVRSFAGENGLEVVAVDKGRRAMTLRGTVKAVAEAFEAQGLQVYEHPTAGRYRGRQGPLTVPSSLAGVITGVFGIDDRPQARAHLRRRAAKAAAQSSYTPPEVAAAYSFPTGVNVSGQTAAILELGGGFSQTDLDTYFQSLGVTAPTVSAVSVDGGTNSPGTDPNADGEVMLDIEVLGSVAPGAKIVVYFAPNTDQGFIDALSTAVHDSTNKPSVVSISWGGPEDSWT